MPVTMERLVLKTYDDSMDRSPLYCGGGAVVFIAMAWWEYSQSDEVGMKFWLLLLTVVFFAAASIWLVQRRRITIELAKDSDGGGHLKTMHPGHPEERVQQSEFAYVKLGDNHVKIHYYRAEELRHISFPIKGGDRGTLEEIIAVLEDWQAGGN